MYTSLNRNAANVYKQMGVQSVVDGASPHTLIQLLFDALEASLNAAKGAMQRGDVDEKGRQIGKAVRILEEGLKAALNQEQGGEIAQNLASLYDYSITQITLANLRNDVSLLEAAQNVIAPVAQGWREMGQTA
ncbi:MULTISPECIES: flagellar export chaperone FliS [Comamonas]|jgi:flagellar protein FliS|uniref:flagellar export chaperone FliS n=1 Tax=Comamonas TaxID=283 RepID=UPI0012CB43B7|nr:MULTISPECIES: flagellar export chaperone FliS [Comamonas]MDR3065350.1 flagellar export chaperone FliS [Comamonas sp.]MEB5966748.1 flagellar export chaperone FliS [Comamonas testosteroni]MPS93887.1 flagellar export chaperone FliS [Comamonas sp.]